MGDVVVRTMGTAEIALTLDWAAAEGWNPGLSDARCFAAADPNGFLVGESDGAVVATVSCVNYSASFAFLGLYIVRPDVRGRGYGLRMWNEAIAHAGSRVIGLDGVVAQQRNYERSGFGLAYRNVRYRGDVPIPAEQASEVIELRDVPITSIAVDDASSFPARRDEFWREWIHAPGHHGRAVQRDGRLVAWGVIRPCRDGWKVGPLIADDRGSAAAVLGGLVADMGGGDVSLDVPSVNRDAVALAEDLGLEPVFETARMYTGEVDPLQLDRIFGVTSFELG